MLPSSGYTRLNTVRSSNNIFTWPSCFSKVVLFSWSNFLYIFFFSCFSLLGFLVFKALYIFSPLFLFLYSNLLLVLNLFFSVKKIKNKKEIEDLEQWNLTSIELVEAHRFCPIFSKTNFQPRRFLFSNCSFYS